jgi:apolipoprotein N-acyltransferase
MLALARPPLDLGFLAFVALVPLFLAWRGRGPRGAAAYAFIAGVVYHGILVSWAWYFGAVAIVPLVVALAAYWAAAGAAVGWFARRGLRSPWIVAAVWVVADAGVSRWPFEGLSWGEVGYALHDFPPARVVASVGGLALVTFLVVAVNGLLADLVTDLAAPARRDLLVRTGAGLAIVVVATMAVVGLRREPTPAGPFRVALLQGNDLNRDLTPAEREARYLPRSHFRLAEAITDPVDLVVFPESSLDEDPRVDRELTRQLVEVATGHDAWVLANAVTDAPDGRAVNLNLLYGPDGELQGTYAKRHLVPYGERVPFRDLLDDYISALDRVPRDFAPGDAPGRFDVAGHPIATVICFESAFGYEIRPLVRDGAEVLVVSTNNRSYKRSANSAQHVAIGQMRAAETGRPIVHAAISGISALIDADGNLRAQTALFERTTVQGTVTAMRGETLYVRWGEWVLWGSVVALAVVVVAHLVGRRRASIDSEAPASADPEPVPAGDRR